VSGRAWLWERWEEDRVLLPKEYGRRQGPRMVNQYAWVSLPLEELEAWRWRKGGFEHVAVLLSRRSLLGLSMWRRGGRKDMWSQGPFRGNQRWRL